MKREQPLDLALSIIAGLALIAMMFLTSLDVIGRYFLSRPVPGAFELTELLLVLAIFLAFPSLSYSGGQIETDALAQVIPPRLWRALYRIARLFAWAICPAAWQWQQWAPVPALARSVAPALPPPPRSRG